jgi:cysteinyl-tRNA synthetase
MIPEAIRRLAAERGRARDARDFARADALRDEIRTAGFDVVDTPAGPELRPIDVDPEPALVDFSVQWVVQGWPEDVERGLASFRRFEAGRSVQYVIVEVEPAGNPHRWPEGVDVAQSPPALGWAAGRNAGLRVARGAVVVVVDGSIEVTGDVFTPLERALSDPDVGVTGPFGIVTDDLREFRESDGPDVDAVEGYLMAFRRDLLAGRLAFDERFRFYRTADIELSFQIRARGLRATVTPLPVHKHEHRMWTTTPEDERARLSRRNFYLFLDRWRGRGDLPVGRPE